jgi:hypothetical protein
MNLIQLWWTAMIHPAKAFDEVKKKLAPFWGLWVVLIFNLMISLTTNLACYLLNQELLLSSWLTFLPDKHYYGGRTFLFACLENSCVVTGCGRRLYVFA